MAVELGGSGGMLRKTSCWKCAKGLKMVIIEKKAELEIMRKEFASQRQLKSYDAEGYETSSWRLR
ncbi:hypothetical protein Hdeb2414_s0015g00452391 [Helianthus debilis subsp. tardiflorus]